MLQPSITSNSWAQTESAKEAIWSFAAVKSIEFVDSRICGTFIGWACAQKWNVDQDTFPPQLFNITHPAEIPPPSLPAINTSRSSQGHHKEPEGHMNLRVANLANERNFCITWPWLDTHHVGIKTKDCYEISWFPVKRKLQLSPANSDNNRKLACTTKSSTKQGKKNAGQYGCWFCTWRLSSCWWSCHWITRVWRARCNRPPQADSISDTRHYSDGN